MAILTLPGTVYTFEKTMLEDNCSVIYGAVSSTIIVYITINALLRISKIEEV